MPQPGSRQEWEKKRVVYANEKKCAWTKRLMLTCRGGNSRRLSEGEHSLGKRSKDEAEDPKSRATCMNPLMDWAGQHWQIERVALAIACNTRGRTKTAGMKNGEVAVAITRSQRRRMARRNENNATKKSTRGQGCSVRSFAVRFVTPSGAEEWIFDRWI